MSAVGQFEQGAAQLASLGGLAERHFGAIGRSLEQAVGILAGLATTFQTLLGDLRGSELTQSRQDLTSVAQRVGTLAVLAQADLDTIQLLAGIAEAIKGRIAQMHAVLQEVDILAMNARLVAATMGEVGAGFLPFAAEIRRSAAAALAGLDRLAQELGGARQHLQAAGQAAVAFVGQHAGTMQAITTRLGASVASIEAHVTLSGNAASIVGARSEEVRGQVAAAIVSLQLGDITRQRIEHVHSACQMFAPGAVPPALVCRLIAAQLLDVAEELEQGAAAIVEELHGLITEAGDIARQGTQAYGTQAYGTQADGTQAYGTQAYGASGHGSGSFLDELEADTHMAQALFGHLRAAYVIANPRITAVLQAAQGLVGHIAAVRSVEADIHIMGLNTSLKCDRLGVVGRPLSVIAQAVRDCGKQTAQHAAAVLEALQRLLAGAGTLAAAETGHSVDAIDTVAQSMTGAASHLGDTGRHIGQALDGLGSDAASVARLLHAAVEGFAVQHEIATVLRDAAADYSRQAEQANDDVAATVATEAVLARIEADYTMARERVVHVRLAPLQGASPDMPQVARPMNGSACATDDAALADMLF